MTFKLEEHSMMMVTFAGMAKSSALEAIDLAEEGKEYQHLFEEVENNLKLAGQEHFKVLQASAESEVKLDVLFIHAEDQMLNAETTYELAKRMVRIFNKINGK